MASSPQPAAIIIGISGPSSSGKTTLARLLQQIFCGVDIPPNEKLNTFIIHEDDFYYPDDQIPYTNTKSGLIQDWDTIGAIDTSFLKQALSYVRENGHLPPRLQSKEDQNEASHPDIEESLISELRNIVHETLSKCGPKPRTIAFMEGFLLYTGLDESPLKGVQDSIHLPLFLPASYSNVKARREGRSGYVTIGPQPTPPTTTTTSHENKNENDNEEELRDLDAEDDRPPQNFWVDPPGYVDDIVWPRYVEDHAWLLSPEDGDGDLISRVGEGVNVREDAGVRVAPGRGGVGIDVVLRWAVDQILEFYVSF